DGIRDATVTGVQTCALPILMDASPEGLQDVPGLGQVIAESIHAYFERPENRTLIAKLEAVGVKMGEPAVPKVEGPLSGREFVLRSEERRVGKEGRSRVWASA